MSDEKHDIHINIGDRVGANKVGEDQLAVGNVSGAGVAIGRRASAGEGGRRRMDDYDVVMALNDLRNQIFVMHGRLASLETQVTNLHDRLHTPPTFGTTQWTLIMIIATLAAGTAVLIAVVD